MGIHHATLKRAEENGINLIEEKHGDLMLVVAYDADTEEELSSDPKAKNALNDAIAVRSAENGSVVPTDAAEDIEADDEEDEDEVPGNVVPEFYKVQYKEHKNTCGDPIALALKRETETIETRDAKRGKKGKVTEVGCSEDDLWRIANANDVDLNRWASRNTGMKAMNLSNTLRGKVYRGEFVEIGGDAWNLTDNVKDLGPDAATGAVLAEAGLPSTPRGHTAVRKIMAKVHGLNLVFRIREELGDDVKNMTNSEIKAKIGEAKNITEALKAITKKEE